MNLYNLSQIIEKRFDVNELQDLCFRLGIEYENLSGSTRKEKVRELVLFCDRHSRLDELLKICKEYRPNESWSLDKSNPPSFSSLNFNNYTHWILISIIIVLGIVLLLNFSPFQRGADSQIATPALNGVLASDSNTSQPESASIASATSSVEVEVTSIVEENNPTSASLTAISTKVATATQAIIEKEPVQTPTPIPTQIPEETEAITNENSDYFAPGSTISDSLAEGAFDEYVFWGEANQPLLFKIQVTEGGLDYRVLFFDALGIEIKDAGYYYQNSDPKIPFTPPETGEFSIRLVGGSALGDYIISMEYVDDPPSDSNHVFPLVVDGSVAENLAIGSVDRFQFTGVENQPLLFTIQVNQGGLDYRVKFFDSLGIEIEDTGYFYQNSNPEIPFTPSESDEYTIQLIGGASFGSYIIKMDYVDDPAPSTDTIFQLNPDDSIQEYLAVKAIDTYRFQGVQNQPLLFTIQVLEGGIDYRVLIFDSSNIEIEDKGYFYQNSSPNIPFTPPESSDYFIKLVGGASFGKYVVKFSFIDDPLPESNTVFPIKDGETYMENLAVKATDTYQFNGIANQTSVFTIQVANGGLDYRVQILDENNNVIEDAGYYYQNATPTISFTPTADGVYLLRLIGGASYGEYILSMETQ